MSGRAALLINCAKQEAQEIRKQSKIQRRTVSGYVMNIVLRAVGYDEELFARFGRLSSFGRGAGNQRKLATPRTTMHIHCSEGEARQIRNAAKRRETTISGFVLRSLWRSWEANQRVANEKLNAATHGRASS